MWIFLTDAFLSVVAHHDRPDHLLVRARVRSDIERVFPYAEVFEDDTADYRYRAIIERTVVARRIAEEAGRIRSTNFKAAVTEPDRHDAYLEVWSAMARWGRKRG